VPKAAVHDALNHLTMINGQAELGLIEAAQGRFLSATQRFNTVKTIVSDTAKILLAAFPGTHAPPAPGLFDLNREALREVAYIEDVLRRKGISVRTVLDRGPMWVEGDEMLMHRALHNLCMNASESIKGGGIIKIVTIADNDTAEIYVSDSGKGMSQRELDHYLSAEPSNGHGYGLLMVQKSVSDVRGHMHVASEPGHGTTFAIAMPRAVVAVAA
jgi:signal transduction histidine kinase